MLDYYKILEVSRTATAQEIRRAYYEKARRYHPDVCQEADAEHVFKLLNESYQTLINPQKRKKYDFKLQYGGLVAFSQTTTRPVQPRSAAYEAYIKRRREEIRQENLRNRKINIILNNLMFWVMAVLISLGLVFGIVDAILTSDFGSLFFVFSFVSLFVVGVIYLRKHKS